MSRPRPALAAWVAAAFELRSRDRAKTAAPPFPLQIVRSSDAFFASADGELLGTTLALMGMHEFHRHLDRPAPSHVLMLFTMAPFALILYAGRRMQRASPTS